MMKEAKLDDDLQMYANYCFYENGKLSFEHWRIKHRIYTTFNQFREWWCGWYAGHKYEVYYTGPKVDVIECKKCHKRLR